MTFRQAIIRPPTLPSTRRYGMPSLFPNLEWLAADKSWNHKSILSELPLYRSERGHVMTDGWKLELELGITAI